MSATAKLCKLLFSRHESHRRDYWRVLHELEAHAEDTKRTVRKAMNGHVLDLEKFTHPKK